MEALLNRLVSDSASTKGYNTSYGSQDNLMIDNVEAAKDDNQYRN